MAKLVWDAEGQKTYETGVDHGVLYVKKSDGTYNKGVVWNGLSTVTESPSGAESNPIYADNIKYLNLVSAEEFGATIEAYTYPDEFAECDGSAAVVNGVYLGQQIRKQFGFVYRTKFGNDIEGTEHGYKLHLIYNAQAAPSEKGYETINDSPEAITFSWEITTTPVVVTTTTTVGGVTTTVATDYKPTASLTIDSTKVDATKLATLEARLFGTENADAELPTPGEVIAIFA